MANLIGLANIVAEFRSERTNLVNQLRHVDAALSVLGKLDGGKVTHKTAPHFVSSRPPSDQPRAEGAVEEGTRSSEYPEA
jgi:hypothetical protein